MLAIRARALPDSDLRLLVGPQVKVRAAPLNKKGAPTALLLSAVSYSLPRDLVHVAASRRTKDILLLDWGREKSILIRDYTLPANIAEVGWVHHAQHGGGWLARACRPQTT